MPIGIYQTNDFTRATLDVWQDQVFYNGVAYPAGYFAAAILNARPGDIDQLITRGGALTHLLPRVQEGTELEAQALFPQLRKIAAEVAEILWTYPPFSFNDKTEERKILNELLDDKSLEDIRRKDSPRHRWILEYYSSFMFVPLAIANFVVAGRFFELGYLRRLRKRDETHFAVAAHDCFTSELFWEDMQELQPLPFERFTVEPLMETTVNFARDPQDEKKMVFVDRKKFNSFMSFYVFDLFNGMHHGHAPSQCLNCGRYFLTTNAHKTKYCDGVAPQNRSMTCRQYGAMMQQKELNSDHPVYRVFSTRTNTIRKHHQRGKIDDAMREMAILIAEEHRDKALLDKSYLAQQYKKDMEQEIVYAEARRRLAEQGRAEP